MTRERSSWGVSPCWDEATWSGACVRHCRPFGPRHGLVRFWFRGVIWTYCPSGRRGDCYERSYSLTQLECLCADYEDHVCLSYLSPNEWSLRVSHCWLAGGRGSSWWHYYVFGCFCWVSQRKENETGTHSCGTLYAESPWEHCDRTRC